MQNNYVSGGVMGKRECSNCYWENAEDGEGNYPDHCNKCTDQDDYWRTVECSPKPLTREELDFMANSRLEHLEMENVDLHLQIETLEYKMNIMYTHVDKLYAEINHLARMLKSTK